MKNLSRYDYVLVNDNVLVDDNIYHYTSVVELINDGFKLRQGEEFVCTAELKTTLAKKVCNIIEIDKHDTDMHLSVLDNGNVYIEQLDEQHTLHDKSDDEVLLWFNDINRRWSRLCDILAHIEDVTGDFLNLISNEYNVSLKNTQGRIVDIIYSKITEK